MSYIRELFENYFGIDNFIELQFGFRTYKMENSFLPDFTFASIVGVQ